ncbi:MAG: glycosyltransferase family 4 protein [Paludibacteraceae bacterium]|nr:glycosyltransferase family 4 protein [Paludibacteraceae bacterium]
MNILFLTMSSGIEKFHSKGIYTDLMRKFRDEGHEIYIVFPRERKHKLTTQVSMQDGAHLLGVKTLNVTKTNVIEKGIGQVSIEFLYKRAIRKYFADVCFDLILYSTPPITFTKVIEYAKKTNPKSKTYLLLKDIFPQNAVDMCMLSKTGVKGLLYKFFRAKEKKLYAISDYIGCMSPANVEYVLKHNPEIPSDRVEIAPNSLELTEWSQSESKTILTKYNLPTDVPIFIYGGNLGVPQGIPFLIRCLEANADRTDCHFVVVGTGTYYQMLSDWIKERNPKAVTIMKGLPKDDYDTLVRVCQVGLIFLDYRFTIPNFPSRLLSYLEYKMPIISCTDSNCDTGFIAEANGFGYYAPSNDVVAFTRTVDKMLASDMIAMGEKGYQFLKKNYLVEHTYYQIMKHL